MEIIEQGYRIVFLSSMAAFAVLICFCLLRAIIGPKIADRIVGVNMIGTMTIMIIAVLSAYLKESYLLDVCLIYAMISFLAVIVLTKVYQGVYREHMEKQKQEKEEN